MLVIHNVEAQLATWEYTKQEQIFTYHIDFDQRRDLAKQYHISRKPALVLLDSDGKIVWKQDLGLSDESPLELETAGFQIEAL